MCFTEYFNIKSMLGFPSTLINVSVATNIVYFLGCGMVPEIAEETNAPLSSESKTKIVDGMLFRRNKGITLRYSGTNNEFFSINLMLIDSYPLKIVAKMVKTHRINRHFID